MSGTDLKKSQYCFFCLNYQMVTILYQVMTILLLILRNEIISRKKNIRLIVLRNQSFVCEVFQAYNVLHGAVLRLHYHYRIGFPKAADACGFHSL